MRVSLVGTTMQQLLNASSTATDVKERPPWPHSLFSFCGYILRRLSDIRYNQLTVLGGTLIDEAFQRCSLPFMNVASDFNINSSKLSTKTLCADFFLLTSDLFLEAKTVNSFLEEMLASQSFHVFGFKVVQHISHLSPLFRQQFSKLSSISCAYEMSLTDERENDLFLKCSNMNSSVTKAIFRFYVVFCCLSSRSLQHEAVSVDVEDCLVKWLFSRLPATRDRNGVLFSSMDGKPRCFYRVFVFKEFCRVMHTEYHAKFLAAINDFKQISLVNETHHRCVSRRSKSRTSSSSKTCELKHCEASQISRLPQVCAEEMRGIKIVYPLFEILRPKLHVFSSYNMAIANSDKHSKESSFELCKLYRVFEVVVKRCFNEKREKIMQIYGGQISLIRKWFSSERVVTLFLYMFLYHDFQTQFLAECFPNFSARSVKEPLLTYKDSVEYKRAELHQHIRELCCYYLYCSLIVFRRPGHALGFPLK